MVEYCVYWLENGEPMHEVFSNRDVLMCDKRERKR
jgi:hypothetical protein